MNAYSRIEVNLLPPELLPGPAVRYALLINILICLVTATFIMVDVYFGWVALDLEKDNLAQTQAEVTSRAYIEHDYNRLAMMGDKLANYGRLVALASMDYIDMPVVLDRLSRIVPDGVYLDSVFNRRSGTGNINMVVQLKSSDNDPRQVINTLDRFKQDQIFAECFLPMAAFKEESLDELVKQVGINWSVTGPNTEGSLISEQYDFEIHARLNRPLLNLPLPTAMDDTLYFTNLMAPPSSSQPSEDSSTDSATQPPEGVTVEEVH
jgi:hypothetical protein